MRKLVYFSTDHPRAVIIATIALTILFAFAFPRIQIDTDPENMLEEDQPDRVYYRAVKKDFGIYDLLVLGIFDEKGAFRPETLNQTARLVDGILRVKGVVTADVLSFTTTDDVTTDGGILRISRILENAPATPAEAGLLRERVLSNPLFAGKLASSDGRALAIYIPIERKDESYRIAGEVETLAGQELKGGQQFYLAGLPVAEDTFGQRFKERYRETGNFADTSTWIFGSPARAISRNAVVISLGFLPLILATLTPYITVGAPQDRMRHLLTVRLTRYLKYQTWRLSLFTFYSPSDQDALLIPEIWHAITDRLSLTVGANVFEGQRQTTFLGQWDRNDNVYVSVRFDF